MDIHEAVRNLRVSKEVDRLHQAMWGNRLVEIRYTPIDTFEVITRVLEPYSFRIGPNGVMFYGFDVRENRTKSFFTDRIRSVTILTRTFKPRWDVEPDSIQDLAESKSANPFPFATAVLEEGNRGPLDVYETVQHMFGEAPHLLSVEKDYVGVPVNDPHVELPEQGLKRRGEYHITILSPDEMRMLMDRHGWTWEVLHTKLNGAPIHGSPKYLCLGKAEKESNAVYYIVVEWPDLQDIRRKMGFDPKDLHITLGFREGDIHDVPKNASTCIANLS